MKKAPANGKEKVSGKVLATRILAIVLSVLMVVGIAYYTIAMIVDSVKSNQETGKEENKTETDTNHDGHDHNDGADDTADDKSDW